MELDGQSSGSIDDQKCIKNARVCANEEGKWDWKDIDPVLCTCMAYSSISNHEKHWNSFLQMIKNLAENVASLLHVFV